MIIGTVMSWHSADTSATQRESEREKDSHCGPTGVWISQCQGKTPFQDWRVFFASFPCFIYFWAQVKKWWRRFVRCQIGWWIFGKRWPGISIRPIAKFDCASESRLCLRFFGWWLMMFCFLGGEVPRLVSGCTGNGWFWKPALGYLDSTMFMILNMYHNMHACLFVFCLPVCLFVCLFVCLSVCLFVCLFVSLFLSFFVSLFVWFFVCLILCLFVYLFVYLFHWLFVACLFVCIVHLFCLFVYACGIQVCCMFTCEHDSG